MAWHPDLDLSECVVEGGGNIWLNTTRLNQAIMRYEDEREDDPARKTLGISGPAGQVL